MRYSTVKAAREYLLDLILHSPQADSCRLPPAGVLARAAGVAESTLLKAVRQLRDEGVLSVSHGKGICILCVPLLPGCSGHRTAVRSHPRLQEITDLLYQRITGGNWDIVPSIKELHHQFGAGYQVLKQALMILRERGVIESYKRSFRCTPVLPPSGMNTLLVISRGVRPGYLVSPGREHHSMLQEVQRQCVRHQLKVVLVPIYNRGDSVLGLEELSNSCRSSLIIGGLLFTEGIERDYLSKILLEIAGAKRPLAIVDRGGYQNLEPFTRRRQFRIYAPSTTGRQPGHDLARYLLKLGHRHVAFIDDVHGEGWALARYEGLANEFRMAGKDHSITRFTPAAVEKPENPLHSFLESVGDACKSRRIEMDKGGAALPELISRVLAVESEINEACSCMKAFESVSCCMRELLCKPEITCIIGANDLAAIAVMRYLQQQDIDVPGRYSVAGFDNSPEAHIAGLTSYSFGFPELIPRILSFLLRPELERKFFRNGTYAAHRGSVMVRQTTCPPAS